MFHKDEIEGTPCSEYRPKVLLAQSNKDDLEKIAHCAEACDKYNFVLASTGTDIINKINSEYFDAVVLGLKFPDITGSTIAYLIHEFDPLISIIFLSSYNSNILISVVEAIGCKFLDKAEAMENLPELCEFIYQTSMETSCENDKLISKEFVNDRRNTYKQYEKLSLPKSIAEVVSLRRNVSYAGSK